MWIQFGDFIITTGCVGIAYHAVKNIELKDEVSKKITKYVKHILIAIGLINVVAIIVREFI
jgi:hypothetical protein